MMKFSKVVTSGAVFALALCIGVECFNVQVHANTINDEIINNNLLNTVENIDVSDNAQVSNWGLSNVSGEDLTRYDDVFRVKPISVVNNGGKYGSSTIDKAWDDDRNSHWETGKPNSDSFQNRVDFTFENPESFSRIIYGARNDASNKGFPTQFEIYSSDTDSGENFELVSSGDAISTGSLIEIKFQEHTFKRLRFVWVEAKENWASARTFLFYKTDNLEQDIRDLFTDSACSSLRASVSMETITNFQKELNSYPLSGNLQPYLDMAAKILSGTIHGDENIHEPMRLSQRGNRNTERNRTATSMTLASFDLSGYYAIPGEVIELFVDADDSGPMPRLVMAAVCQNTTWVYGYDGIELVNGYNRIKLPDTMQSAQAIYFYNPALPDEQKFAPTVRLIGGTKYPVYRYDANDSVEVTRKKEADFIAELKEYEKNITDDYNEAKAGNGNYNIAEYVSDKILISVSARGAINSLDNTKIWDKGDYKDWEDKARFGKKVYDITNNLTGISYGGPAAVMECYEMLFDDIQIYSGFNNNDPTHPDYRNYGQFLFRAYNDGSGLGWGQSLYSGYNTGSQPNGSKWDNGFYEELVSVDTILNAGWAIFHEIGHVFDSALIGTSESTNNLYGLMAQLKYTGTNRMAAPDEDRWYNHFTNYINTGVLPQNDLLFYPGAVIYQLDAIDFSSTTLYQDIANGDDLLSNYGRAGRYARLHRNQLNGMSYTDRLVISFSMSCGVDLSTHFGYYGRTISDEAKRIISGLPKETRPTWIVNDRTFAGSAFSAEDKAKSPVISSTNVDAVTGEVTINLDDDIYTAQNLQTFSIYRREVDTSDSPLEDYQWIGITGDKKTSKSINELYIFKDKNVKPGKRYQYSIGAYDCTLMEVNGRGEVIVAISDDATVPLSTLLINKGDEGKTMSVGETYKVQAVFAPVSATIDLNSIEWTVEGYGRDEGKTGGGPDIITLLPDPDFPNDPTRRIAKGIQPGQTHIKVSVGGLVQTIRMVINGNIDLNTDTYNFAFANDNVALVEGAKQKLTLERMHKTIDETINVETTPSGATWRSKNTAIATVSDRGEVSAIATGETDIEFVYQDVVLATCHIKVNSLAVALTGLNISGVDTLSVGNSSKLSYTMLPNNTTETKKPEWSSSDATVVFVDTNGLISAKKSGEATITAKIDGVVGTHKVTVPSYISLKNVTMNPSTSATLTDSNNTIQLSLVKEPLNATASEVIWQSSSPEVASVNSTGLVSGVSSGTATITGYIDGKSASCTITVEASTPLTGIQFRGYAVGENINVTLKVDEAYQLMVYPVPIRANNLSATKWTSTNPAVATVKEGYITALSEGTTEIVGTIVQNEGTASEIVREVKCSVTVNSNARPLKDLGINYPSLGLGVGEEVNLVLSNQPTNANKASDGISPIGNDTWTSSNSSIVSVDANGKIKALGVGEAKITAVRGGITIVSDVVVHSANIEATSITLNKNTLALKTTDYAGEKLISTLTPANATVGTFWKSSNTAVARVDQAGNVQPVGVGEAVITASANNHIATCNVTVSIDGEGPKPDTEKPSAPGNVVASNITQTEATITWEASSDNIGVLGYRIYVNDVILSDVNNSTLTVELKDLAPAKEYKVKVSAFDKAGNESDFGGTKFVSLPSATAPNAPVNIQVGEISETLATITWEEPTENSGILGYIIYRNGENVGEVNFDTTRFVLEGLLPNSTYEVAVVSFNVAREESSRISLTFDTAKTEPVPDTQKPTKPSDLVVKAISQNQGTIIWNASSDNVGVAGYYIYVDGKKVNEVKADVFYTTLLNLVANTSYQVGISAFDEAGNESDQATISFTTLEIVPVVDNIKPSKPSSIRVDGISQTQGTVIWGASTDNVGVVGYYIYVGGTKVNAVNANVLSTTLQGLAAGSTYNVGISAIDAAKNESEQTTISFTALPNEPAVTPETPTKPSEGNGNSNNNTTNNGGSNDGNNYNTGNGIYKVIYQTSENVGNTINKEPETSYIPLEVQIKDITETSANVTWKTPIDSNGIAGYIVYKNGEKVGEIPIDVYDFKLNTLTANTEYEIAIASYNDAREEFISEKVKFTTNVKDSIKTNTTLPNDVVIGDITKDSAKLTWKAPSDSKKILGYSIYLDDKKIEEVKANVFETTLSNLKSGTTYKVSITTIDQEKQESNPVILEFKTSGSNTFGFVLVGTSTTIVGAILFVAFKLFKIR